MSRRRQIVGTGDGDAQPSFVVFCRVLILLIGLLLLATPWTEGYRLLDNFPRGQDAEVHLLALLAFLGLVLLLARSRNRNVCFALTLGFWLSAVLRHIVRIPLLITQPETASAHHSPPIPAARHASFHLPLLI